MSDRERVLEEALRAIRAEFDRALADVLALKSITTDYYEKRHYEAREQQLAQHILQIDNALASPSSAGAVCAELEAAHSTMAEQQKQIAELESRIAAFEAHHEEKDQLIIGLVRDVERLSDARTAERQRRESAEEALRWLANNKHSLSEAERLAKYHFVTYKTERSAG